MELMINNGKGYVPAPKNRSEESPLGLISIDSLFSPVKKVSFAVRKLDTLGHIVMSDDKHQLGVPLDVKKNSGRNSTNKSSNSCYEELQILQVGYSFFLNTHLIQGDPYLLKNYP